MLTFMILCYIWFLQTFLICCDENPTVMRFSVPKDHQVCLRCGGSDRSHVVWTLQDRQVLVTRQGSYVTNEDRQRYLLQPDGGLCVLQLDDSDNGEYRCNQLLVAELQVLTGTDHDFMVSAGRTLLLPCSRSHKLKQRWFHQRKGGRREAIFTLFRNGTAKAEREGSRLSFKNKSLQIQDLQPEDAGEYQCNGKLQGNVTVLTVQNEPTSIQTSNSTPLTSAVGITEAQRHEDTELQPWKTSSNRPAEREVSESPSLPEETIHYASLGHQNWRERPSRTPPDQDLHHVIYSSVITRPAVK
ncbi:uncharacterized protein LOC111230635 isoform X6 [Seriola dumerili]|uniref:uncharacterized protein LOC111230635 isoform X6 n=1 Tax=Seriola dumerili TaxID=41447 RepID=UPI000BBE8991|nr:uncharacterized protein LOC111230635 isoform X6 [Seriola dumerili]